VFACQKFRVFLLGHKITVFTDHQALIFLYRCRLRNVRLTRWTLLLQEYDLHIEHCPGKDNIIDVLSRNPIGRNEVPPDIMPSILRVKVDVPPKLPIEFVNSFNTLSQDQYTDSRLASIFMNLESPLSTLHKFYKIHHGILFFRCFPHVLLILYFFLNFFYCWSFTPTELSPQISINLNKRSPFSTVNIGVILFNTDSCIPMFFYCNKSCDFLHHYGVFRVVGWRPI